MAEVFPIGSSKNWSTSTVGDVKEWELDIDSIGGYLEILVSGNTGGTDVTIALNPNFYTGSTDTRIFPDSRTGNSSCKGTSTDATVKIKTQSSYPDSNNVPDFYLPRGHWKLTLTANKASSVTTKVSLTPLAEEISPPSKPNGPASATLNQSCTYIIGGASSNISDALKYQVDWGDGTNKSAWTDAATALAGLSHTWTTSGTWAVTAQAECSIHTTKKSISGPALNVVVGTTLETVSKPQFPQGPTTGNTNQSLTYTTGGSVDSLGDTIEYSILWGDGTQSTWSTTPSFTKSSGYTSAGTYQLIALARCQTHTSIQTQSDPTSVNIGAITEAFTTLPQMATTGNPSNGQTQIQYTFTAITAILNTGHPVEYRFDLGDNPGTYTAWSSALTTTHTYTANSPTGNPYQIKVQARCSIETNDMSAWSNPWPMTIGTVTEVVSQPNAPTGGPGGTGQVGQSYTFTTGGSTDSLGSGHPVLYQFDWGDGTQSTWSTSTTASKSWSTANTYQVKAQAKCSLDGTLSNKSNALSITISGETVSQPSKPIGPAAGNVTTSYSFTTSGSSSTLGHQIEYQFNWGDGTTSNWGTGADSHKWVTSNKTYYVTARARCKSDTGVISLNSDSASIAIDVTATTEIAIFNPKNKTYGAGGYAFGCYDSKGYVYYAPAYTRYGTTGPGGTAIFHGILMRYNTSLDFETSTSWEVQDLTQLASLGSFATGFHGAISYGNYIYFIQLSDMSSGSPLTGSNCIRFYTGGDNNISNSSNWEYINIATALSDANLGGFVLGFEANGYIYYVPWQTPAGAINGNLVRFNTAGVAGAYSSNFKNPANWSYVNLKSFPVFPKCMYKPITVPEWVHDRANWNLTEGQNYCIPRNDNTSNAGKYNTVYKMTSYVTSNTTGSVEPVWNATIGQTTHDGQPLPDGITWTCVSQETPSLVDTDPATDHGAFHGGCYDGKYIYIGAHFFGSSKAAEGTRLVFQCDVSSDWTNSSNWKVFDLGRLFESEIRNLNIGWTYGMIASGGKVYAVCNAAQASAPTYGKPIVMARCKNAANFEKVTSWEAVKMTDVEPDVPNQIAIWPDTVSLGPGNYFGVGTTSYAFGCTDGTYVYFAPDFGGIHYQNANGTYGQTSGIVARHQISSPNMSTGWSFIDLVNVKDKHLQGFHGCVTDNTYLYMIGISYGDVDPDTLSLFTSTLGASQSRVPRTYHAKIKLSTSLWVPGHGTILESMNMPNIPTGGPSGGTGDIGSSYTFNISGGSSSLGHTIQYCFDWGDSENSGWLATGVTSASHSWAISGNYSVRGKCRCASDTGFESPLSNALIIYIQPSAGQETVGVPTNFNGDSTLIVNHESKYSCTLPTTSKGHTEQLYIDWGDSTNTGWLPKGTSYAYKSWSAQGSYQIKAKARCSNPSDSGNESAWTTTFGVSVLPDGGVADYVFDTGIIDVTSGYSTSDGDSTFAKNNKIGTETDSVTIIRWDQAIVAYNNAALNVTISDLVGKLKTNSVKFAMGLNPNPAAIDTFVTNASSLVSAMNTQLNYWYSQGYMTVGQVARIFIDIPIDVSYPYTGTTWLAGLRNFINAAITTLYNTVNGKGSYTGMEIWWRIVFNDLKGLRNSVSSAAFQTEYTTILSGIASDSSIVAKNIKLFSCLSDGIGNYEKPGNPTSMYGTRQTGNADYITMLLYTQAHYNCATTNVKCKSICDLWRYTDAVLTNQTSGGTDEALDKNYEAFKFTATSTSFNKVKISVKRDVGMTAGTLQLFLYSNNASNKPGAKISGSVDSSIYQYYTVTTSYSTIEFDLSVTGLAIGTSYWVVIKQTSTGGNFYIDRT